MYDEFKHYHIIFYYNYPLAESLKIICVIHNLKGLPLTPQEKNYGSGYTLNELKTAHQKPIFHHKELKKCAYDSKIANQEREKQEK